MATGVYSITNKTNGKKYVGSAAKSLSRRWSSHRYYLNKGTHKNLHLQRAWLKYGRDKFEFSVLEECEPEECVTKEQVWIDSLGTCDRQHGYNKSPTAGSPLGFKHTKETRDKVSAALKGKKKSEEHRAKMVARVFTTEHREKLSLAAKNRTKEHKKKLWASRRDNQRR